MEEALLPHIRFQGKCFLCPFKASNRSSRQTIHILISTKPDPLPYQWGELDKVEQEVPQATSYPNHSALYECQCPTKKLCPIC